MDYSHLSDDFNESGSYHSVTACTVDGNEQTLAEFKGDGGVRNAKAVYAKIKERIAQEDIIFDIPYFLSSLNNVK